MSAGPLWTDLHAKKQPLILSLPGDVLDAILLRASLEERVAVVSSCRRLRQHGLSSPALWESIKFVCDKLSEAESFACWTARNGRLIKRLQYYSFRVHGGREMEAATVASCILTNLAGSPMVSLYWGPGVPVQPPQLAACAALPKLKHLDLNAPIGGSVGSGFEVPRELSRLTHLTSLSLSWAACRFPDGIALPPSLLALKAKLSGAVAAEPDPAARLLPLLGGVGRLQRLQLSLAPDAEGALDCSGLEGLQQLTFLALRRCNLTDLPLQVLKLKELQCLDLSDNFLAAANLAPLTELRCLRQLDLSICCLTSLPSVLLESGSLEALGLFHNERLELPEAPQGLGRLKSLGIDLEALIWTATPRYLTSLTCLQLRAEHQEQHEGMGELRLLFQALRQHRMLQLLTFDLEVAAVIGFAPDLEAYSEFLRQMPQMKVRHEEGFKLPAEEEFERWDMVQP